MQRLVAIPVALFALSMAGSALAGPPRGPRAPQPDDALVADGTAKLEAGDAEAAIALFRKAEAMAPRDPRPRYLRGQALSKKDPAAAVAAYREALALDETLAAVHAELGALLSDQGQLDEAVAELKAALKFDPGLADAWSNIARIEGRRGKTDAALAAFAEAEKLAPRDVDVRIDHVMALRKAGRHDDAVRLGREAVALDGKSAAAHKALAFALQSAGKLDDAVAEFTVVTRIVPEDASAHWALGVAERDRKHLKEAIASLRRAAELKGAPSIVEDLATTLIADKQQPQAIEIIKAAAAKSPRSLAMRLSLARVLSAAGQCADATSALEGMPPDEQAVRTTSDEVKRRCPAKAAQKGGGTKGGKPAAAPRGGR